MAVQEGRFIPIEVLEGLHKQNVNFKLWVSTRDDGNQAAGARNRVKQYATSKYLLTMDNDLVLEPYSIKKLVTFLDRNPNFGAIAINKYRVPPGNGEAIVESHIDSAPVLWRLELLKKITYEYRVQKDHEGKDYIGCECLAAGQDVRAMGYEIGFLTGIRCHHIKETKSHLIGG